ncbi:MAG: inositol monophosphatase family protein [Vicinamibacterales bacterium]
MVDPRFLATAVEIVLRAGDIQQQGQADGFTVAKKGAIDLVTEIDLACERMCRAVIAEHFPDHAVVGEELGADTRDASHRWIFDPIDGTTNYAHGLPIYCASLALEIDGVAEVGAVFDPSRHELFTAERGSGAFMNGTPLRVSETDALTDALLVTGFPYDIRARGPELVELFAALLERSRAVRRLGSAALDLCYVAAGRFDGFWEQHLQHWDIAAGVLIVREAGGTVTGMDGTSLDVSQPHLLATNGQIHERMLTAIRESRA